ncbi:alpha-amylase [Paenibacillus alkaliterrae]|uniref:alpha-amylase n=1 Tax=Paenibacillus alkaliterrae TaxID=320909 RepID=UPI001F209305|nr:alpha-amylase [Paenibacillus alkaliterrae]MCF2941224.1 alpha-amylase [Paenibacillus alkaliterrae]
MNTKLHNHPSEQQAMVLEDLSPLARISSFIRSRISDNTTLVWLPAVWNTCGYADILEVKQGEILVAAYPFLDAHLEQLGRDAHRYHLEEATNLDESVIYSSLVRYSTAWDTDHDGNIESGTFLKMILLLPLLKQMGVNILYMLPVTRYSTINLKGDIGSPYAVQSMFELDPNLHDPLLDDMTSITLNDEMSALVAACHLLDIKVTVDFIPRVTARNSDLIRNHPEWVYWIHNEALEGFAPPPIPELDFFEECKPDKLETVYRSGETAAFLAKFSLPPNDLNEELWLQLKHRSQETGEELLHLIEEEMGITTAPAHSDWINDVQPIWTDITFLRLYADNNPLVEHLIKPDQAPYVLFDTIKCNYYPAKKPNRELWDLLIEGLRFNLNTYGIDGFRIDIGHVLPVPLLDEMFDVVKSIKPEALLISEDLFNRNHQKAAAVGYNIMLGSGWNIMTDITKDNLTEYLRELPQLAIHVFACAETADTPRITSRGGVALARMIAVLNGFLPNAIPYITTGFEMNEELPLNCGLGDNTDGADIPRAFFNRMQIDWSKSESMIPLLSELHEFKSLKRNLMDAEKFFVAESPEHVVMYGYMDEEERLICCFNLSGDQAVELSLAPFRNVDAAWKVGIDSHFRQEQLSSAALSANKVKLQPYQAIIFTC